MKARTLVELLTLSSNLYLISKDKEFFNRLEEMAEKGRKKVNEVIEELSDGEGDDGKLLNKLLHKASQAKEELERRMEEIAAAAYKKMHIAHTDEVRVLQSEIEGLKKQLALSEARILLLESKTASK